MVVNLLTPMEGRLSRNPIPERYNYVSSRCESDNIRLTGYTTVYSSSDVWSDCHMISFPEVWTLYKTLSPNDVWNAFDEKELPAHLLMINIQSLPALYLADSTAN